MVIFFPRWNLARREAATRRWSRRLHAILSVRVSYEHAPAHFPERTFLVLNHISWLDIFLVDALHPAMFIAKAEIARWPLLGALVRLAGTLFIERGSRAALRRTNDGVRDALASGRLVACFPEGTTSYGESVGRFHTGLFQPAIDAKASVIPAAIRYTDENGERSRATDYVGEESLLLSLWRLASARRINAHITFRRPLAAAHCERRELSHQAHVSIARVMTQSE